MVQVHQPCARTAETVVAHFSANREVYSELGEFVMLGLQSELPIRYNYDHTLQLTPHEAMSLPFLATVTIGVVLLRNPT